MNKDFLLELRSEEIPARMQGKAKDDLARLFTDALAKAGLKAEGIETFATPRRLALIASGLPLETEAVSEETKGPKLGAPPQALEGFLRKTGLTQDQLTTRDGIYFAVVEKPGRRTADVLAEAIPAIIRAFPWPKSQRWGAASVSTESLRWVRPLQGIVALLGEDIVPCAIDGLTSGRATMGHRFHSSGPVEIANAAAYAETLRAAHVIVHFSERCRIIREGAAKCASDAGLVLVEDEGLVAENAGLTEWPVPMLGRFDPAFLAVPEEVIQLTARVNQKYFVCKPSPLQGRGGSGEAAEGEGALADVRALSDSPLSPTLSPEGERGLTNAFICTANIVANDGGSAIVAGNEKVLAARLSDAKFFYEQDLKVSLDVQREKLSNIVFHEKLGTVADKVERVAKLARWLCEEGIVQHRIPERSRGTSSSKAENRKEEEGLDFARHSPSTSLRKAELADMAERAARLCKVDLVTGMVGEFPELQGIMGGYYARAQGEDDAVADAVRDHYKPVGQGGDVPTAPVTVAVSLADKLDTIVGFFALRQRPTGSKDPYALRRAALGVCLIVLHNGIRLPLIDALIALYSHYFETTSAFFIRMGNFDQVADKDHFAALAYEKRTKDNGKYYGEFLEFLLTHLQDSNDGIRLEFFEWVNFFADRLKVQQREAGVRHDLIDAVFALGGEDDLVRLLARVKALQAFVGTEEGRNLLAAYKRAANILKGSGGETPPRHPELVSGSMPQNASASEVEAWMLKQVQHDEERVLLAALNTAEPLAAAAIERDDFEAAMSALASLRAPIDAFFDGVMVNDPDPEKRAVRIGLLARFRDAVHKVADFSKIEG